jgi:hypothetical protein
MVWCSKKKLEKRRKEAVSDIIGERLAFETMLQRARIAGELPDEVFVQDVMGRFEKYEAKARQVTDLAELDNLACDAEKQGWLRAYVCPVVEVADEGNLAIDLMEEWNLPKAVTAKLRRTLGKKLDDTADHPESARGALRAIFEESDTWSRYTGEYEKEMRKLTYFLAVAMAGGLVAASFAIRFPPTTPAGLLLSGVAGSCASVMAKMPMLEVVLSGALESYRRRILIRVCVGAAASLTGSALLGWGLLPIAIQGQTFAQMLVSCCSPGQSGSCSTVATLVLMGVPMLFGFSERALAHFEHQILANKS